MTREEFISRIKKEFEDNGIAYEMISETYYVINVGHKRFYLGFYKISVSISANYMVEPYVGETLMTMNFFYEDIENLWVADGILFVRPAMRSFNAFRINAQ